MALIWATLIAREGAADKGVKWTMGQVEDPPADSPTCAPLSKAHLAQFANNNTLLITVVDQLIMRKFGKSWVENVKSAGISYWMVAALDPWTSKLLGHWGVKSCFNAPLERMRYKGSGETPCAMRYASPHTCMQGALSTCPLSSLADTNYKWGSSHWHETTWNKVHVMAAVRGF